MGRWIWIRACYVGAILHIIYSVSHSVRSRWHERYNTGSMWHTHNARTPPARPAAALAIGPHVHWPHDVMAAGSRDRHRTTHRTKHFPTLPDQAPLRHPSSSPPPPRTVALIHHMLPHARRRPPVGAP